MDRHYLYVICMCLAAFSSAPALLLLGGRFATATSEGNSTHPRNADLVHRKWVFADGYGAQGMRFESAKSRCALT